MAKIVRKISKNPIMVRPTLVVGLGGTGALVCQWLEWFIRCTFGRVPPFIRFLILDTDAMEEGGPPGARQEDFINLFQHMDIGAVVRDSVKFPQSHRHLDWFMPFAKRLDAVFADYGCQGIPRLGRLVFAELREKVIHKEVSLRFGQLKAVTQSDLADYTDQFTLNSDGAPAVHIACSVCGGTGAGMSIDMAYSLREWARESFRRRAEIIGHLVLPEAFAIDPILQPKLRAVAAATLEQIEFLSDARRSDLSVSYRGILGTVPFDRLTTPFNFTYLVNGNGDRDKNTQRQLVRMIARAIQAMTLEPTSKLVASESNNKLADALGLYDPANGRRQCFSSYGLHQGICAHGDGDLALWLCSRLKEMEGTGSSATEEFKDLAKTVSQSMDSLLQVSSRAKELGQDGAFGSLPDMHESRDVVADIIKSVEGYFKTRETSLHKRCRSISEPVREAILKTVADMIMKAIDVDKRPLGYAAACLKQWFVGLESWSKADRSGEASSSNAVKEQVKEQIRSALLELAETVPGGVDALGSEEIVKIVRGAIKTHWQALAEACLRESLREAVEMAARVLHVQHRILESLAQLASNGSVSECMANNAEENGHSQNGFVTRLTRVHPQDGTILDPTDDVSKNLGRSFRQSLIRPILQDVVFSLKSPTDCEAELAKTKERLTACVERLIDKRKAFMKEVEEESKRKFCERLSNGQVADHEYCRSVRNIYDLAAPRIGLDVANKYAEPLGVVISQHAPGCCVPDLLGQGNAREAEVSEAFEHDTGIWFQLLRISYGFCLEALSHYEDYRKATDQYVSDRMRLKPFDMWLDENWYWDYRKVKEKWGQGEALAGSRSDANYDEIKMLHRQVYKTAEFMFNVLDESVDDFATGDPRKAMEASRKCAVARDRIMDGLHNLTPDDRAAMSAGYRVFTTAVEELMVTLGEVLQRMPPTRLNDFTGEWKKCRDLIEQIDAMIGADLEPKP